MFKYQVQLSSVLRKVNRLEEQQKVILEQQAELSTICKNILHLIKKMNKKNIDQYKVSAKVASCPNLPTISCIKICTLSEHYWYKYLTI